IVDSINGVSTKADDVSQSTGQAGTVTNGISDNIQDINMAITHSRSRVEEMNTATEDIARMAASLNQMISRFKV
ncbi:MAG: hypothetical protein HRT88_17315, partial [Lentisphaeraceae bacterium]|nr:hypothetical protein [Lentisphaeraceae bacterium]